MNPNIANIVMKKYLAINVNIAIPKIIKIIFYKINSFYNIIKYNI